MSVPHQPPSVSRDPAVSRRIVDAARETFFRHGFRSVTMDDLAAQMGMSKKTLYQHFRSKQELLAAVIERKFADLEQQLAGIGAGGEGDFSGLLVAFVDCLGTSVREITPTFVRDVAKADPSLRERIFARRRAVLGEALGRILAVGRRVGAVRSDLSAELLVEILLGLVNTVAVPETVIRHGMAPHVMIHGILDVFLHGVLTSQPCSARTS